MGLLPGRWGHAGWAVLVIATAAFIGVNFF
jgi:hypothetical protein